jgi:hypothetical protein
MEYVATQRCPCCKSTDTKVSSIELPRSHKYHEPGVSVRWSCSNCRADFEPSGQHVMLPVLMCERCKVPTKHKFLRSDRGVFKSLATEVQSPGTQSAPVLHELYACPCGTVRVFGSVGLEIPKLSLVGREPVAVSSSDSAISA